MADLEDYRWLLLAVLSGDKGCFHEGTDTAVCDFQQWLKKQIENPAAILDVINVEVSDVQAAEARLIQMQNAFIDGLNVTE